MSKHARKRPTSFTAGIKTPQQRAYATPLIAATAREMAAEVYEMLATDNKFYRYWPDINVFVSKWSPSFLEAARHALIQILASDASEAIKQPIYEELLLDKGIAEAAERGTIN